jgi:hypothetical protein
MAATTSDMLNKGAKAYEKAWDEAPKEFEACKDCKTPGYCKAQGCQSKEAAKMKKLEG